MPMDEAALAANIASGGTELNEQFDGIEGLTKEFVPLYEHFQIDRTERTDKALAQIWDYCKTTSPEKDKDSVILQVIRLQHELGSSGLGEPPYAKMLRYVKIFNRFKEEGKLLEEMRSGK